MSGFSRGAIAVAPARKLCALTLDQGRTDQQTKYRTAMVASAQPRAPRCCDSRVQRLVPALDFNAWVPPALCVFPCPYRCGLHLVRGRSKRRETANSFDHRNPKACVGLRSFAQDWPAVGESGSGHARVFRSIALSCCPGLHFSRPPVSYHFSVQGRTSVSKVQASRGWAWTAQKVSAIAAGRGIASSPSEAISSANRSRTASESIRPSTIM